MIEQNRQIPITRAYDVIVAGGGIAGVSAALAARRSGARTLLLEREFALGGLATLGLVTIYLPLCDGQGRQVSYGIAEELLRLSISEGHEGNLPVDWLNGNVPSGHVPSMRFQAQFNPQLFALLLEERLRQEGVDLLYGCALTGAQVRQGTIQAIWVESKSGPLAFEARSFVDATGDADLCHFAHAPTRTFGQGNVLAAWYYALGQSGYHLQTLGAADIPDKDKARGAKAAKPLIQRRFAALDGQELSEMAECSHQAMLRHLRTRRSGDSTLMPVTMAAIPQVRMTRCLEARVMLEEDSARRYHSRIGVIGNWKRPGPSYEIPFEALYSDQIKNLAVAGRCIGVTDDMWDVTRVIPACAVTGQAAGTAAALFDDFGRADIQLLQQTLSEAGVRLDAAR